MKNSPLAFSLALSFTLAACPVFGAAIVYSGSGADPASITAVRDLFRVDVGGGAVAGANGSFGGLRREINWDGVPDALSAPANLPANFFNANSPRGVVFATPGTGFQVSANAVLPPIEFGNVNPTYPGIFQTFSAQRLFAAVGSNIVDVNFFVAGTATPGATSAFASIFTDVDLANTTTIEYFSGTTSLGLFSAPVADNGLSFLGVRFNAGERVSRVRITSGNAALGPNDGSGVDVVAMDDFLYSEVSVPEPSTLLLLAAALLACRVTRNSADRRIGA